MQLSVTMVKSRAIVPEQATGFQISAQQLEVIDLGTEFGMNVSSTGEIEVVVYEGKVELHKNEAKPGDVPEMEVSELNAGESIFVDSKGKLVKIDMPKANSSVQLVWQSAPLRNCRLVIHVGLSTVKK